MTYLGRTWHYTQLESTPSGYSVLKSVQPPKGLGTDYDYGGTALYGQVAKRVVLDRAPARLERIGIWVADTKIPRFDSDAAIWNVLSRGDR